MRWERVLAVVLGVAAWGAIGAALLLTLAAVLLR